MSTRFVTVDRDTPMPLPPDLRDWVKPDDPVHLVLSLVHALPPEAFRINERGTESTQYPPPMMLARLIFCYSERIFSSRRIEHGKEKWREKTTSKQNKTTSLLVPSPKSPNDDLRIPSPLHGNNNVRNLSPTACLI